MWCIVSYKLSKFVTAYQFLKKLTAGLKCLMTHMYTVEQLQRKGEGGRGRGRGRERKGEDMHNNNGFQH